MPIDLLAALRVAIGLVRSPTSIRLARKARGLPSVKASIGASDVYTGFGLITGVPEQLLTANPDIEEVRRAEKKEGVFVAPATLVVALWLASHEASTRVEELYLDPIERLNVSEASKLIAVLYVPPGAGGKGEPAEFSVWHRGGLNTSIPLMQAAERAGGNITQPTVVQEVPYGIVLRVHPTEPGLYAYRLRARFRMHERAWTEDLNTPFRLLVLGQEDHRLFAGALTLVHDVPDDRVDRVLERFPEGGLGLRNSDAAWGGRPLLDAGQSYLVDGRSEAWDRMLGNRYQPPRT